VGTVGERRRGWCRKGRRRDRAARGASSARQQAQAGRRPSQGRVQAARTCGEERLLPGCVGSLVRRTTCVRARLSAVEVRRGADGRAAAAESAGLRKMSIMGIMGEKR
jgi:hypothetical protein